MRITIGILDSLLNKHYCTEHRGLWNRKESIKNILLWNGQCDEKNVLYINSKSVISESVISEDIYSCGHRVLTIVTDSEKELVRCKDGYFLFCRDDDKEAAVNTVLRTFSACRQWIQEVRELAYIDHDIRKLLQSGSDYLNCNCTIINVHYEIEQVSSAEDIDFKWDALDFTNLINAAEIEDIYLSHPDFDSTFTEKKLLYFVNSMNPELSCYYYNFFDRGEYLGRILIGAAVQFSEDELDLYEYFAKQVSYCYIYKVKNAKSGVLSNKLHIAFYDLLIGSEIDRAKTITVLQNVNWSDSHTYEILKLSTKGNVHSQYTLAYFCRKIEKDIPSVLAVELGDNIICLHNISVDSDKDIMMKSLPYFLRDNLFQAGISCKFTNFFDCRIYEHEASFALLSGSEANPDMWIHYFSKWSYNYCLKKITEDYPVKDLIQPALNKIYEYDRQHPETELANTLYQYIANQYNATETARKLHIHRTTLLYRLKKMQEIAPFDLDNPEICLHLLLSYTIFPELKKTYY